MQANINIANKISRIRKEAKLTQADLADYLGVSKASVSKWETGQSYPDIEMLPKIATYFGITIDDLLGYEPQMTKTGIKSDCAHLRKSFAEKPFEEVHAECQALARDYYSCYPLLEQIAILYLNHLALADEFKREAVIEEAVELCQRIRKNASTSAIVKEAETIEASFMLIAGKPQLAIELLEGAVQLEMGADVLLAQAYEAVGLIDEANTAMQSMLFQSLVLDLNRLTEMAKRSIADRDKLSIIHQRALALINAFDFEKAYVNTAAIHATFALVYMMGGDVENTLDCLDDYVRACRQLEFPIKLHGDSFFDRIDAWIEEANIIGSSTPRDDTLNKQSLVESIAGNPVFAPLAEDAHFKLIVKNLEEIVRD